MNRVEYNNNNNVLRYTRTVRVPGRYLYFEWMTNARCWMAAVIREEMIREDDSLDTYDERVRYAAKRKFEQQRLNV